MGSESSYIVTYGNLLSFRKEAHACHLVNKNCLSGLYSACAGLLDRIGDKWSLYIIGTLQGGPMRFNEIRRHIEGISQRMLTLNPART